MPSNDVLAILEFRGGQVTKAGPEVLGQARRLADTLGGAVHAFLYGEGANGAAAALGGYGVTKAYVADSPAFAAYNGGLVARAAKDAVAACDPRLVLLAATSPGKDLGPRIAASLDAGLAVDCTAIDIDGDALTAVRPVYAGKANQSIRIAAAPFVASIRPNVFPPAEAGAGDAEVVALDTAAAEGETRIKVAEVAPRETGKVELTEADVIVSGGRGLKGPEHFHLVEELAEALGAAVGASRAVVDAGWRPHSEQVGQTGKTVSPNLYFACGISGAIQHVAGMSSSKCIVAINKDPEASIFKLADYGVVGDVFEVLPALTEQIRALKG